MKINAGVLIDLGNSETRAMLLFCGKQKLFNISNRFAELPKGYKIQKSYALKGDTTIFIHDGLCIANGRMVTKEFQSSYFEPGSYAPKTTQNTTDCTLNMVFIECIKFLMQEYNCNAEDLDLSFNVSVLLPPKEEKEMSSQMIDKIMAMNHVDVRMPVAFKSSFSIEKVEVQPEGVAAFFGAFFEEKDGELIECKENSKFGTGSVLVVDIGAGTTDLIIIQDCELVYGSRETFKIGGNTVRSIIEQEVSSKYGISLANSSTYERVITEGILEVGAKEFDIADIVTEAKQKYSKQLSTKLKRYIAGIDAEISSLKGLLVVGGGSLVSVRDGEVVSPAMSEILIKDITNEIAPYSELMSTHGINTRLLNIEGLKIMYKYV